jgi:hypothetical protein
VKKRCILCLLAFPLLLSCGQQRVEGGDPAAGDAAKDVGCAVQTVAGNPGKKLWMPPTPDGLPPREIAVDSMDVRNPFIIYERNRNLYYMTGDGGYMWTSEDMRVWKGPYNVIEPGAGAWMGESPSVFSPEIYRHNGKYYYLASFGITSEGDGQNGTAACGVLVADDIFGPYRSIEGSKPLTDVGGTACWPTLTSDGEHSNLFLYVEPADGDSGAEVKILMLADGQEKVLGEPFVLLESSRLPWGGKVIESPDVFFTEEGSLGMLFTSIKNGRSVIGVAYSLMELGHPLNGPWVVEEKPLVEENAGGASMFTDYDGTKVLVMHKETEMGGLKRYVPRFLKMETQFEKLQNKGYHIF